MDPWQVVALLAIAGLVGMTALAVRRGLAIERGRRAEASVRRLHAEGVRLTTTLSAARRDREALIELLDLGIVDLDADLRLVSANAAAHAYLGRAPGTLPGLTAIEAFLDAQVESIAAAALAQGPAVGEVRLRGADGPTLIVRARRSTAGGVWIVLQDVSELRRLQRIRTEFIDNLSHELRTPLSTVSLLAETLAREAAAEEAVPARMRDRITKIEVETGHLVQMVSELLDLSRIESGSSLGLIDEVDLGRLAVETVERLRLFAERQRIMLAVDVPEPVPTVRGDEARLGQVLVNLVHNAVKFSPDGGPVTVRVRSDGDDVVAAVNDAGIGIPEGAQARIFERFYKVDRARARGEAGGTGLGLAIARHVVEQHGGRIWVESAEGAGSTFSFAIPRSVEDV